MAELKKCNADEIEALISATPDSGVCKLSKKEYYITRRIEIRARHGLTLDGNGAKIITRYKNNAHPTESSELFLIEGCEDVMLCNIVADTDVPVNVSATVESVDKERGSAIFKIDDNFQINGDEQLTFFDSIDGDGSPDWLLHHYFLHPDRSVETVMQREILLANTYWSAKYDYLGERRFRVYFPLEERKLEKTFAGQRVSIRHTDKGPGAIVLKNSDRTVLRDITLHSVPGMAVIVLPRCTDLSIERMHVIPAKESGCYFACNFDGIHVAGLGGKLILKDCNFFGMGDDSLNVHSTMGTLTAILGEKSFKCNYCKKSRNGELGDSWCREGLCTTSETRLRILFIR